MPGRHDPFSVNSGEKYLCSAWHFRYAQRPEAVLRGMQLDIKPGEMIAITGASGVGKTTLLRIIAGLYPPSSRLCADR